MRLQDDNFLIRFDPERNRVLFEGVLRLSGPTEYGRIERFLLDILELDLPRLEMDFSDLEFLNSAGISMLCHFIFQAKEKDKMPLAIRGNRDVLWQKKSFSNLQQLWEKIELSLS
jgi:hypothetical protein